MKCEQFEDLLNQELDQRRDPAENTQISSHANQCLPCQQVLEVYSAISDFSNGPTPSQRQTSRLGFGYALTFAAAVVLLVILNPLGGIDFGNSEKVDVAQASPNSKTNATDSSRPADSQDTGGLSFWKRSPIADMVAMNPLEFQVPEGPNLENVGQKITTVWQRIQRDQMILPLIRQSAFIWMPK